MRKVNIYLHTNIKGPQKKPGVGLYVLETETNRNAPASLQQTMELTATENKANLQILIKALTRITQPCSLDIYTDSVYMAAGFDRMEKWEESGWVTAKGTDVKNKEEWIQLKEMMEKHEYVFHVGEHHEYKNWMIREADKRMENERDRTKIR